MSLPVQGAWIEIGKVRCAPGERVSLPVQGAWIEINQAERGKTMEETSLPVQGAWIEIPFTAIISAATAVAPRAGSVD